MEDWTCLGQHKRQPEFPVVTQESRRNSRKTTWLPRHRKMKPFPDTAPQEKSHVRNWRSKGHLAPLMRPTKFPEIPIGKTTWLPRHRKMKPFPATAPQEKSHVSNWRSKGHLAPLMRPTKFPEIPVSLERNTEVFRHPLL